MELEIHRFLDEKQSHWDGGWDDSVVYQEVLKVCSPVQSISGDQIGASEWPQFYHKDPEMWAPRRCLWTVSPWYFTSGQSSYSVSPKSPIFEIHYSREMMWNILEITHRFKMMNINRVVKEGSYCSTAMSTQPALHSGFFAWFMLLWPRHDYISGQINLKGVNFEKPTNFWKTWMGHN